MRIALIRTVTFRRSNGAFLGLLVIRTARLGCAGMRTTQLLVPDIRSAQYSSRIEMI